MNILHIIIYKNELSVYIFGKQYSKTLKKPTEKNIILFLIVKYIENKLIGKKLMGNNNG